METTTRWKQSEGREKKETYRETGHRRTRENGGKAGEIKNDLQMLAGCFGHLG